MNVNRLPCALSSRRQKRDQGFTLVEMLIYSGILVVFLYVLTSMLVSILDLELNSQTTSVMSQDSRFILSRFEYDIARASDIVTPASLGQQTTTLVLHIGASDYTYSLNNGNLELAGPSENGSLNSYGTTVSNVSFRRYGNVSGKNSVRIVFTLTTTTQRTSGAETQDFQTTIGLR